MRQSGSEDEAVKLAMEETAASMAAQGKRVWEPAQTETSKQIEALRYVVELVAGVRNDGGFSPTEVKPLKLRRLARAALSVEIKGG